MKVEYTNRYNDTYTFTLQEDGDILWEGEFKHCRFGWPNVYKDAYQQYCKDIGSKGGHPMYKDTFTEEVHSGTYADAGHWIPSEINEKYASLVYSDTKKISMVDPSGGPYIASDMDMECIDKLFKGRIVRSFVRKETGYLIQTYGEFDHLQDRDIIGGII
jgi:hypothetical protein